MSDLRRFLDEAQEMHARHPRAGLDELLARAATLRADETGAEAINQAGHVCWPTSPMPAR